MLAVLILLLRFKCLLIHWPASQELLLFLFVNDELGTLCLLLRPILGSPFWGVIDGLAVDLQPLILSIHLLELWA